MMDQIGSSSQSLRVLCHHVVLREDINILEDLAATLFRMK